MTSHDSFKTRRSLTVGGETLHYYSLPALQAAGHAGVGRLPYSLRILLENLLRREDGRWVRPADIETLAGWDVTSGGQQELAFMPARVLLQDFTGVPAVVDLAAMRDGIVKLGGDPAKVNPLQPVELVIDHSVQVDHFGVEGAFGLNVALEYQRNGERYEFLRWGQNAFNNFRVVPPGTGIVHQVNIEYLARVVCRETLDGETLAYPDTLFGTDSHTTMVNGLGVVGWGVGGIEAEAAMLGQPSSMLIPDVVGFKLSGKLQEGITATDLVLTITERLRKHGVVGKFVEFYGAGLSALTIADRVTIGNMSPEYGLTIAVFPIDVMTLDYLRLTGRDEASVALVEAYARAQGLFRTDDTPDAEYTTTIELDLSKVEPSLAGPRRPQDRVPLKSAKAMFGTALSSMLAEPKKGAKKTASQGGGTAVAVEAPAWADQVEHGAVVVAAITSCTNTSNPSVMIAAGLVAKKAHERGLTRKPWVKTSLAPGSQVVTEYLDKADLSRHLDALGFNLVGYGCTTCIGNSGPLPDDVSALVDEKNLVVCSVLSGNRNFEGRIQPQVRANYLASPPLVVAYALAGSLTVDITTEPLGQDRNGEDVYLKDLWPTQQEIQQTMLSAVQSDMFRRKYADVFKGDERWQNLPAPEGALFDWQGDSTYIAHPPYFEGMTLEPAPVRDINGARVLALLGDSVTTDHISPAGAIKADSPAGQYLMAQGVQPRDFNSYGARRGNHEVMMRGTFANIRLRNQIAPGTEGGVTLHLPDGEQMSIYDAAMVYERDGVPLIVLAGKEYGSGSSRDWAAKGTRLLGARAVIAESFERIHRSNLVNMGVVPLEFMPGESAESLGLTGRETYDIALTALAPRGELPVTATSDEGKSRTFHVRVRIDTPEELMAYTHGGIMPYVVRQLLRVTATLDLAALRGHAWSLGFDLCGVAPVGPGDDLDRLTPWVDAGYVGDLDYITRSADARRDPSRVLHGARAAIVTGTIYNTSHPRSIDRDAPGDARIARYAWGEDYHEVLGRRLHLLIGWMKEHAGTPFDAVAYVDTGPVQEKALAARAGLGWIGKHSCLINQQLGSWMFLSTILMTLDLPTGAPVADRCGTCTRCLDICPTDAIVAPYVVDARRCLSYLTIESHQDVPDEWRSAVGAQVYGCDLCQDVCPWNHGAAVTDDPVWVARPIWAEATLAALWRASDETLQAAIRGSTLYRSRVWRLRRNLTLAIAASGDADAISALREDRDPAVDASFAHPVVQRHRDWALTRIASATRQV